MYAKKPEGRTDLISDEVADHLHASGALWAYADTPYAIILYRRPDQRTAQQRSDLHTEMQKIVAECLALDAKLAEEARGQPLTYVDPRYIR